MRKLEKFTKRVFSGLAAITIAVSTLLCDVGTVFGATKQTLTRCDVTVYDYDTKAKLLTLDTITETYTSYNTSINVTPYVAFSRARYLFETKYQISETFGKYNNIYPSWVEADGKNIDYSYSTKTQVNVTTPDVTPTHSDLYVKYDSDDISHDAFTVNYFGLTDTTSDTREFSLSFETDAIKALYESSYPGITENAVVTWFGGTDIETTSKLDEHIIVDKDSYNALCTSDNRGTFTVSYNDNSYDFFSPIKKQFAYEIPEIEGATLTGMWKTTSNYNSNMYILVYSNGLAFFMGNDEIDGSLTYTDEYIDEFSKKYNFTSTDITNFSEELTHKYAPNLKRSDYSFYLKTVNIGDNTYRFIGDTITIFEGVKYDTYRSISNKEFVKHAIIKSGVSNSNVTLFENMPNLEDIVFENSCDDDIFSKINIKNCGNNTQNGITVDFKDNHAYASTYSYFIYGSKLAALPTDKYGVSVYAENCDFISDIINIDATNSSPINFKYDNNNVKVINATGDSRKGNKYNYNLWSGYFTGVLNIAKDAYLKDNLSYANSPFAIKAYWYNSDGTKNAYSDMLLHGIQPYTYTLEFNDAMKSVSNIVSTQKLSRTMSEDDVKSRINYSLISYDASYADNTTVNNTLKSDNFEIDSVTSVEENGKSYFKVTGTIKDEVPVITGVINNPYFVENNKSQISYNSFPVEFKIEKADVNVETTVDLDITQLPTNLEYYEDGNLIADLSGIKANAIYTYKTSNATGYSDILQSTVDVSDKLTATDASSSGKITVSYTDGVLTADKDIDIVWVTTVSDNTWTDDSELVITKYPNKMSYSEGETIDITGIKVSAKLFKVYSNGKTEASLAPVDVVSLDTKIAASLENNDSTLKIDERNRGKVRLIVRNIYSTEDNIIDYYVDVIPSLTSVKIVNAVITSKPVVSVYAEGSDFCKNGLSVIPVQKDIWSNGRESSERNGNIIGYEDIQLTDNCYNLSLAQTYVTVRISNDYTDYDIQIPISVVSKDNLTNISTKDVTSDYDSTPKRYIKQYKISMPDNCKFNEGMIIASFASDELLDCSISFDKTKIKKGEFATATVSYTSDVDVNSNIKFSIVDVKSFIKDTDAKFDNSKYIIDEAPEINADEWDYDIIKGYGLQKNTNIPNDATCINDCEEAYNSSKLNTSFIRLNKYIGDNENVKIYAAYTVDGVIYPTVLGEVKTEGERFTGDSKAKAIFEDKDKIKTVVFYNYRFVKDNEQIVIETLFDFDNSDAIKNVDYYDGQISSEGSLTPYEYATYDNRMDGSDTGYLNYYMYNSSEALNFVYNDDMIDREINAEDWEYNYSDGKFYIGNLSSLKPKYVRTDYVRSAKSLFSNCGVLKSVENIPNNAEKCTYMFNNCKSLEYITNIPSNALDMEKMFYQCEKLTTTGTNIPSNAITIEGAFYKCKSLNPTFRYSVPDSCKSIVYAWFNCKSLEKAPYIPMDLNITAMDNSFNGCSVMQELPHIPYTVTNLYFAFKGCASAVKIMDDMPCVLMSDEYNEKYVSKLILSDAFRGCKNLKADIYINTQQLAYVAPVSLNYDADVDGKIYTYAPYKKAETYRKTGCIYIDYSPDTSRWTTYDDWKAYYYENLASGLTYNGYYDILKNNEAYYRYYKEDHGNPMYYNLVFKPIEEIHNTYLDSSSENYYCRYNSDEKSSIGMSILPNKHLLNQDYIRVNNKDTVSLPYGYIVESLISANTFSPDKGIFWETSLFDDAQINLHITDLSIGQDMIDKASSLGDGIAQPVTNAIASGKTNIVLSSWNGNKVSIKSEAIDNIDNIKKPVDCGYIIDINLSSKVPVTTFEFYDDDKITKLGETKIKWGSEYEAIESPVDKIQPSIAVQSLHQPVITSNSMIAQYFNKPDLCKTIITKHFKGWKTEDGTYQSFSGIKSDTDTKTIKLYADYEETVEHNAKLTLQYKLIPVDGTKDDASVYKTIKYNYGDTVNLISDKPEDIIINGIGKFGEPDVKTYTFDKWISDTSIPNVFTGDFDTTITLYGSYKLSSEHFIVSRTLDSITIVTPPDKTDYKIKDTFNKTGMTVDAIYKNIWSDGSVTYTTINDVAYDVDTITKLDATNTNVTVSYTDNGITKQALQPIIVTDGIESTIFDSLTISKHANKLKYNTDDIFDSTGLIIDANYTDVYLSGKTISRVESNIKYKLIDAARKLNTNDTVMTASYTDLGVTHTVNETITVNPIIISTELDHIEISNAPNKIIYSYGDKFDRTGMTIDAYYKNTWSNGSETITVDKNTSYDVIDEDKSLGLSNTNVTISKTQDGITKTVIQPINVKNYIIEHVLDSIIIATPPDKIEYKTNETFDKTGMVIDAKYKNIWADGDITYEIIKDIKNYDVDTATKLKYTDTERVVSLTDNGIIKTAIQDITVDPIIENEILDKIVVRQSPDRLVYNENDLFDKTGMIVDAYYKQLWSNGYVTENIIKDVKNYTYDKTLPLTVDDDKVIISLTDNNITKSANVKIMVTEVKLRTVTVNGILKYDDGTPIANRVVELHSTPVRVKTDDNGYYEFKDVEVGEHTLTVFAADETTVDGVVNIFVDGTINSKKDSAAVDVETDITFDINIANDIFAINGLIEKPVESTPEPSQPITPLPVTPVISTDVPVQNNPVPAIQTGDPAQVTKWLILMIISATVFIVSFTIGLFKRHKIK